SLEAIAEENAREGCVRETFGALVATFQAVHAVDPEIREVMKTIALEETEHAALAWDVDRWLSTKLSEDFGETLEKFKEAALSDLDRSLENAFISSRLGLPSKAQSRALLRGLRPELLAA